MNQLVSIIIPTYKSDVTLQRAIDSVLKQDYAWLEVIVVDDNNPDTEERIKTESMMEKYSGNDLVKYLKHDKNKNGSAARNTGFNASKGEFICLLDDDDFFFKEKISRQVEYLNMHEEYGACYTGRIEKIMGEEVTIQSDLVGDLTKELLLLEFTPYTSSLMIRRECYEGINGFDESYYRHQDFEFMLRFFKKYSLGSVDEVLVQRDDNGVDNQPRGKKLDDIKKKFFSQFADDIERLEVENPGIKKEIYSRHYVSVVKRHIRCHEIKLAMKNSIYMTKVCGFKFWKLVGLDVYGAIKRRIVVWNKKYE